VIDFLIKWFVGPLGNYLIMREVGWCLGPLKSGRFSRESLSVDGFRLWISNHMNELKDMNILMGVGFWLDPNYLDPIENIMLYDRLSFDFDCEGGKEKAVKEALNFALSVEKELNVTPVVFESGFKGAHVVIPLSRPTDWEGYQLIWKYFYSKIPKDVKALVDRNMLQWNRLDRVPLTWNIKEVGKAFAKIIYPEEFNHKTFDWGRLRGLNPNNIIIYKVVLPEIPKPKKLKPNTQNASTTNQLLIKLPEDPIKLTDLEATPPCVRKWLCELRDTGDLDHYERVNLVLFFKSLGYSVDSMVDLFRKYAKDFKENITKYQVEYLYGLRGVRKDWKPYSCSKLKTLGLCLNCGWDRNPVTYFRKHIKQYNKVSTELPNSLPPELIGFLNETKLSEFTYEDFRKWLEGRRSLTASEWHYWERLLRKLAEDGKLGRKFLVGGEWVDYGPGPVKNPPSKAVKFYFLP